MKKLLLAFVGIAMVSFAAYSSLLSRVSRKIAQEIQRTDCQSNKYFVS